MIRVRIAASPHLRTICVEAAASPRPLPDESLRGRAPGSSPTSAARRFDVLDSTTSFLPLATSRSNASAQPSSSKPPLWSTPYWSSTIAS